MGATAKFKPLKLNWRMPFGKYKGEVIRDIIDKDQSYFNWLLTTNVEFDNMVHLYYKSDKDGRLNFDRKITKMSISRAIVLSNWQTIRVKPEDRNFDLKPEDFDDDPKIAKEENMVSAFDFSF